MIKFEILDIWAGWKHAQTPDNLKLSLSHDDERHETSASLRDVVELYYRIENQVSGDMSFGTGGPVVLSMRSTGTDPDVNTVRFELRPIDTEIRYAELRSAVRTLVKRAFEAHDQQGYRDLRTRELNHLQEWIDRLGLDGDVQQLYADDDE
ncbi:hypothetical protein [Halobaculum sp. EA56]|uniref:hypothetical protein n=1 Tax=Halobaculum sp. EA56 TaxID=3421648 RepID=UPI003EBC6DA4